MLLSSLCHPRRPTLPSGAGKPGLLAVIMVAIAIVAVGLLESAIVVITDIDNAGDLVVVITGLFVIAGD